MKDFLKLYGMEIKQFNTYRSGKDVYKIEKKMTDVIDKIDLELKYGGVLLGRYYKKKFYASLGILDYLECETKIIIDDKAEWLFLCGKDIFLESIKKKTGKGRYALIFNLRKEILGIGKVQKDQVKNIMDKGDFLRRERR